MSDSNPPPADALTAATQMVKNGRLELARETLMAYLVKNPSSEQAWLLMSYVLSDPAKQKDCLERVLKINPNKTVAQSKLAHLLGRRTEELFSKKVLPPQPPAPDPEPEPIPAPIEEPGPSVAPIPEKRTPAQKMAAEQVSEISPEPPASQTELVAAPVRKSLFSGKWFRIITIILLAVIGILIAVILYVGVIGPVISGVLATPTSTVAPVSTVELPPQWTQTLTPTATISPPVTAAPTATPALTPTETTIP
jgi:hypothetical protein